jgi:2-C-methyl-D-erythritol 4-phosphate cytidylyltransferase/2-C-methyl-D-erythritol 2,4-cyclodiphosphate synthase
MPVGVIIVAAGRGSRLGAEIPKQLLDLGGRSMLQRSVTAFDAHPSVAHLVVVLPEDLAARGREMVQSSRPCAFVAGGVRRQDSVRLGLAAMPADADVILVHDAARPFVDAALIDRVIDGAALSGAVVPAVQSSDTVKRVNLENLVVTETLPRDEIWLVQTPQGFHRHVLAAAVALGESDALATDEGVLAERAGHPVTVVRGDERNRKITSAQDLAAARASLAAVPRVGTGYDLHRLADGRRLVLAGVEISADRGPVGHSDGDVVCHAIVDALLGAAGAGDIGRHFPDGDARWKDAAGLDLLARAVAILADRGWMPSSADVTVVLERPKLAAHMDTIGARVAEVLGVAVSHVGVKAKTNEGVDAVGRGEAIAAHAVAVIVAGAR